MRHMSKTNFQINIHDILLQKRSDKNDYIDLPDLIFNNEKLLKTQLLMFVFFHFTDVYNVRVCLFVFFVSKIYL